MNIPYINNRNNFLFREHPDYHPESINYLKYWKEEKRRIIEGYWGQDTIDNKETGMWEPNEYTGGSPVVTKRYDFSNSLEWVVQHNMNTTSFRETLVHSDGSKFSAKTRIIDENSFVVNLTSAESGWVDVIFNM